jgi:hypothetical protein
MSPSLPDTLGGPPLVSVTVHIVGDFYPDAVTGALGIEPTSTARRGERIRTATTVVPVADRWSRSIDERNTFDPRPLLELGIEQLEGVAGRLDHIRELDRGVAIRLSVAAYLAFNAGRSVPNLVLDRDLLARLARLGVGLWQNYTLLLEDESKSPLN